VQGVGVLDVQVGGDRVACRLDGQMQADAVAIGEPVVVTAGVGVGEQLVMGERPPEILHGEDWAEMADPGGRRVGVSRRAWHAGESTRMAESGQ
jgi:hypothetical protein